MITKYNFIQHFPLKILKIVILDYHFFAKIDKKSSTILDYNLHHYFLIVI